MTRLYCFLLALLIAFSSSPRVMAQALDPTFQPTVLKDLVSTPPSRQLVRALAVQPDGKMLIAGGFDFVNGGVHSHIHRLNANGTPDPTFNPTGSGPDGSVYAVVVQPDGKILVGGDFTVYNGAPVRSLIRLNPDGTLDSSFATNLPQTNVVFAIARQADGKILFGGQFDTGMVNPLVLRLQANGALDTSYSNGAGLGGGAGRAYSIVVQPDGRVVVGGNFIQYDGHSVTHLVRLTATGAFDSSLASLDGAVAGVRSLALQPDGKLLVGGSFTGVNGQATGSLVRLLAAGGLDNAFVTGTGTNNNVYSIQVEAGGSILVGGLFTQYNGVARNYVARVLATGGLDTGFAAGAGANNAVYTLAALGNGQYVAAGWLTQYAGTSLTGVAPLSATGGLGTAFTPPLLEFRGSVGEVQPLATGKLLVSGLFSAVNGTSFNTGLNYRNIVRMNTDGTLDSTYPTLAYPSSALYEGHNYFLQTDGQVLIVQQVGSNFRVVRYLVSGVQDASFQSPTSSGVTQIAGLQIAAVQPNGAVLIYGSFTTYGGLARPGLARLLPTGGIDATFVPAVPAQSTVDRLWVQPSGKIVVHWLSTNTLATQLTRLTATGSADNTFPVISNSSNELYPRLMQPDGKLLLTGNFTQFNGQPTPHSAVRLTVDGALDTSFSGVQARFTPLCVQPDGRLLVAEEDATALVRLRRLTATGAPDATFNPIPFSESRFAGSYGVGGAAVQPADGKVVVYGSFRYVLGQPRIGLARLDPTVGTANRTTVAETPLQFYPNPTTGVVQLHIAGAFQAQQVQVLNALGQQVITQPLTGPTLTVDLSNQASGIYTMRVSGPTGSLTRRLVVSR